jgi:cytidine deaminase
MYTIDTSMLWSRRKMKLDIAEHWHLIKGLIWYLADEARRVALESSVSYRPFPVGCALLAFKPDAYYYEDVHKVFRGANVKTGKDRAKICAEQVAINAARAERYKLVIGIAIAGNPQPDDKSGLISKTLHPCYDCRESFRVLPIIHPDMRILSVHIEDDGIFEEFTVKELWQMHGENSSIKMI